jgi:hypothetical protein
VVLKDYSEDSFAEFGDMMIFITWGFLDIAICILLFIRLLIAGKWRVLQLIKTHKKAFTFLFFAFLTPIILYLQFYLSH